MRDVGLADRIRAKGVRVVEVAGWKDRGNDGGGYPTFRPRGAIHHHTAGSAHKAAPSLATVIYGRPGVPGPLSQVLQSREPDGRDIAYVVAAGKANHGGVGTWTGNSGTFDTNYESEGLEVEHTGYGPVPKGRHEISARILAAMLEAPGSSRDASMCCEHFEYARPLGRKVDFRELEPYTAATFRLRVAYWIGRTVGGTQPPPTPVPSEEDDMAAIQLRASGRHNVLILGGTAFGWDSEARRGRLLTALKDAGVPVHALQVSAEDYDFLYAKMVTQGDLDKVLAQADNLSDREALQMHAHLQAALKPDGYLYKAFVKAAAEAVAAIHPLA